MADDMVEVSAADLRTVLDAYDWYTDGVANDEPHAAHYEASRLRAALPRKPSKGDVTLLVAVTGLRREHAHVALEHLHELGYELRKVES